MEKPSFSKLYSIENELKRIKITSNFASGSNSSFKAIPHKERLAILHAICLQISLQSLFRIFPHASCVHIFPSSLKKSDDASVAQSLCGIALT
ncbi:hypothetical protein [Ruminococcus callidus]|uniref:hypothetical protein n=1 Tax=Ruminococcus callidus TaxID=40519 RepID=UPI003522F5AB